MCKSETARVPSSFGGLHMMQSGEGEYKCEQRWTAGSLLSWSGTFLSSLIATAVPQRLKTLS